MTSGNFETFPVDKIVVLREDRQRKTLRGIDELAESIHRLGLIHPLVINDDDVLVAGERRISAVKLLGWTHVPIQRSRDLDPTYLHALELEENVKRQDITWQEQCDAILKYEELRKQQDPSISQEQVAKELGFTGPAISRNLAVGKALREGNERVRSADKFSTALNIVERNNSRARESKLEQVAKSVADTIKLPDEVPEGVLKKTVPLLNEDFHEWTAAYCGRKFNMIHCDFPYGVGMHRSDQGAGQEYGTYEDGEDVYWKLLDTLETGMDNVVAD